MTIDLVDSLPKHSYKKYSKRDLKKIKRIVVHHFAGNISIEDAATLHVSKGWPGIGYHFVIEKDGTTNLTQRLDTISYNVGNNNTPTIGIAVRGDFTHELPLSCQLYALEELIDSLRIILGELPVYGHYEFRATECPGKKFRGWLSYKYPSPPQPLSVPLSKIRRWWKNLWEGKDHA